jgi:integrase
MGAFMEGLRQEAGVSAGALEFAILTAARSGEVRGARWSEIDMQAGIWTIPTERMKARKEHRVPLSAPTLALLGTMAKLRTVDNPDRFVFPGRRAGQPLGVTALAKVLQRMQRSELTVHGFRSSFRDWVAEATGYPREVAEAALAHVVGNKVEAAYQRGDLFEKRRRLMEEWAEFCSRSLAQYGRVVAIRA